MLVPFNKISDQARIWIYQMSRIASDDEQKIICTKVESFCKRWKSHKKPVESSFNLFHDQFVVLAVDEQRDSIGGCSIDGSIRIFVKLQHDLNIDFLDRTRIACWINNQVKVYSIVQLKTDIATGVLTTSALMFNNLIPIKRDLNENWKIPIKSSWVAKQLSNIEIGSSSVNYEKV